MAKVIVFGIGKSSPYLIKCLQSYSLSFPLHITLVDTTWQGLPQDCKNHENTNYVTSNINDHNKLDILVNTHDLVISMLPASLHITIAKLCLHHQKNLLTASYVSAEMKQLHSEAHDKGVLFLNEMGVDPGLDHMSALHLIHNLKKQNAQVTKFYSHTGGLVSQTIPNTWNYKFTWNPKNIITAGAEGATYISHKQKTNIAYDSIFKTLLPVHIQSKKYDSYPNRNSLGYAQKYELATIDTFYRGTLRHQGYCEAWQIFVQLGMTDDNKLLEFKTTATRKDFLRHFLGKSKLVENNFCTTIGVKKDTAIFKKFELLDFFNDSKKLLLQNGTAADILLSILKTDWQIQATDKDLLLMQHEIHYTLNNHAYISKSELAITGKNQQYTAMAKTVGAPMFEAAILMLNNQLKLTGVHIPTEPTIYEPILIKLKSHGLEFSETTQLIS